MHTFDYSFLKGYTSSQDFAHRLDSMSSLKEITKEFVQDSPKSARDMSELSKIISAMETSDIEGISSEGSRLMYLLTGLEEPWGQLENELVGYLDALKRVHDEHESLKIDEDTILGLYSTMTSFTGERGRWMEKTDEIVYRNAMGAVVQRYKIVAQVDVEESMKQLIAAYGKAKEDPAISNILLIPCFILDFMKIQPFIDGNGKMSRLLTILMMYHEGLDVCKYVSIESIIERSQYDYYDAITRSGERWSDGTNDYIPFIEYMIGVIYLAYRELDDIRSVCTGKESKSNRVERIMSIISIPLSKKELCILMPDIPSAYMTNLLRTMVQEGRLQEIGSKHRRRYVPILD